MDKHIRTMRTELSHLNKTRKPSKKAAVAAPSGEASSSVPLHPVVAPAVRNPERSVTKGKEDLRMHLS